MSTLLVVLQAAPRHRRRPSRRHPALRRAPLPAAKRRVRAAPLPLTGLTLLVVEDHRDSRELLRQMLTARGARVLLAEHGRDALALLGWEHPDAILLDLLMPVMDGFTFAEHVQAEPRWAGIPIIALTALGGDLDYQRTWAAGFAAHVTKPIDHAVLVSVIGRVMRAHRNAARSRARRRKPSD